MLLQAGLGCKKSKLLAGVTEEKMCWINWQMMRKMSLEIHWASLSCVHAVGLKCCSACPTAETYKSLALRGLFAILNLLWEGKQKFIWGPYRKISVPGVTSLKEASLCWKRNVAGARNHFFWASWGNIPRSAQGISFCDDDDDDDATDLPAVLSGGPDSNNNSTQSSLNVPISVTT